jgi:NADPH:quinone reductase-like Zn-dependent oxidoreductase/DNA-binding XRE family transcriptional regulator
VVRPTSVTNSIRALRFAHGEMTQAELAERIGVTRQTVIAIEQDRYSPSLEMAFRIARVFDVPLDEVFQYPEGEEHMKAIVQDRYGPADVLRFEDVDAPVAGDDEVLVRVRAAGVDPGVWHLMTGLPLMIRPAYGLRKPKTRIRGRDVAGRVEAVGKNVTRFRPGDEVFGICEGSFAELAVVPERKLAHKPGNVTFEEAAAAPISGLTALQGLRDVGKVRPGQKVLIIGAGGGVGSFAVQLAHAFGAHVTGVCSASKAELVRSLGADDVIDYTREDFTSRPGRFDLILDTAGRRRLSHLRRALTRRGTLVLVGGEGGGRWLGGFDRGFRAVALSLIVPQRLRMLISTEGTEDLEALKDLIEAGKLKPVVERTYPLADAPDAIRHLAEGHVRAKLVVAV